MALHIAHACDELVTYEEALTLLNETGHGVSRSTLRRWVAEEDMPVVKDGRALYVSYSDVLVAHGRWVRAREAGRTVP